MYEFLVLCIEIFWKKNSNVEGMEQNNCFVHQTQCKQYISQPTQYINRCSFVTRNAITFPQSPKVSNVLALAAMPLSLASSKALSLGQLAICPVWFPSPGAALNVTLCLKMPAKVPWTGAMYFFSHLHSSHCNFVSRYIWQKAKDKYFFSCF